MKLILNEDKLIDETIIDITYKNYNYQLQEIIDIVKGNTIELEGFYREKQYFIKIDEIFYIETVDRLTFLYTEDNILENNDKIYELEQQLIQTSLIRINKSTILNMNYLKYVTPLPNYRLEATLKNNEKLIISRHYMKTVKNYLNI